MSTTTVSCPGIALKLRTIAEKMPAKIEHLRRPLTQNSTPKRQREYNSRVIDGDNLERGRLAMLALADAWERGDVPEPLKELRTKDTICFLVRHGITSTGYYHVASTHQYVDQSEAGKTLQALLDQSLGQASKEEQEATKRQRDLEGMIDRVRFLSIPGFFPTPPAVIQMMLGKANIRREHIVLEPSAGIGSICDAVRFLGVAPLVCEVNHALRDILKAKGYRFWGETFGSDFLACYATSDLDLPNRIVMNPPFEKGADCDHICHAYNVLDSRGGRLVSIVSAGPFFRQDQKSEAFRQWLETVGAEVEDLPEDAFQGGSAFRPTGTRCKMIVIDKDQ